jgi:two-component system cell cycle response regulator
MTLITDSLPPMPNDPPRILCVDGDDARRARTVGVLLGEGYVVDGMRGSDAVAAYTRVAAPDLILLDAGADDEGFERCGELRMLDEGRLVPIILLAHDPCSEERVVRGLLAGADDFFTQPARVDELKARVRVQLRNRRDRCLLAWARQQRASFRRAALVDPLTQIYNRRAADDALEESLRAGGAVMVLLLDIDHFKAVNDSWGHGVGDQVLRNVAQVLQRVTRQGDVIARFGGEEFVVIARGAAADCAERVAERFRRSVAEARLDVGSGPAGVTVSVGVCAWDGLGRRPAASALLALADEALYEAKRAGRDRVCARAMPAVSPSRLPEPREVTL